jgi:hypothetical protein
LPTHDRVKIQSIGKTSGLSRIGYLTEPVGFTEEIRELVPNYLEKVVRGDDRAQGAGAV